MPQHLLRRVYLPILIVLIIISLAIIPAGAAYQLTKEDLKHVMPLSEVRAGMQGYGLTVFRGTKIEKFGVTIVGIMPKVNMGGSWILAKLDGGPMTERRANVISGMSGSPVYLNGRIIGAVGYGGSFSTEPIAMITPIEDMLESWDPNLPVRPSGHSSIEGSGALDVPLAINGRTVTNILIQEPNASPTPQVSDTLVMTPLTKVSVSGLSARGVRRLADLLGPYGLGVTAGPGSGSLPSRPKVDLKPGAAVGMSLTTGDIDMTGIGTVTYRSGNKIVAFGHPFFGIGAIDAPMTTAYVHDVLPSLMVSEKLASPMETIGRISQDRPFSIGGVIGSMPRMIPVTVDVKDASTNRRKTYNVQVLNHPLLVPTLIPVVVGESIYQMHPTPGEATATVSFEVEADQVGSIRKQNVVFDPVAVDGAALSDLADLLYTLKNNRIQPLDVRSVNMTVEITDKRNTATIERIFVEKGRYEPGETVDVGVVLKPYKQDRVTTSVRLTIPPSTPNGRLSLSIRGGSFSGMPMLMMGGPPGGDPGAEDGMAGRPPSGMGSETYVADNVSQLVKKYLEKEKNNEIVGRLLLSSSAVELYGEKLPFLPAHIAGVMRSSKSTALRTQRDEVKVVVPTEFVVTGSQTLSIVVQKRDMSEKKESPKADSPSSPSPSSPPPMQVSGGSPADVIGGSFLDDEFLAEDPSVIEEFTEPDAVSPLAVEVRPRPAQAGLAQLLAGRTGEAAATPRPSPTPSSSGSTAGVEGKPVGRAAAVWTQKLQRDFTTGFSVGLSPTSGNDLRLTHHLERLTDTTETIVWDAVPDGKGGIYAGTGHGGKLIRVSADGAMETVLDTPEFEVFSLAKDSAENLYIGTSPNGILYKVSPDGKAQNILDAEEQHIVAVALDSKGNVYAGAGDKCKVYKISPDGSTQVFFESADGSAHALAVGPNDNLYVGTASRGLIYMITPDGAATTLYDSTESSVVSLAVDAAGSVYAGTASKPTVVKISPEGAAKTLLPRAGTPIMALHIDASGNVYASAQDKVYRIQPDEVVTEADTVEDVQFSSVCVDDAGRMFVATANTGMIYAGSDKSPLRGTYESVAHDAKVTSRWGTIGWTASTPEGTAVEISTRTGNSSNPDDTWSGWSPVYQTPSGSRIASPPARYIQYRAVLKSDKSLVTPILQAVNVIYMPSNQAPVVNITAPSGGERWSKKQTIKWTGSDPDKDVLTYDIYYSSDNGVIWRPLKKGAKSTPGGSEASTDSAGQKAEPSPDASVESESDDGEDVEIDESDEISEETMAQIIADLKADPQMSVRIVNMAQEELAVTTPAADDGSDSEKKEAPAAGNQKPEDKPEAKTDKVSDPEVSESTKETSYSWDTKTVPDGVYLLKVVASDRTSNAVGALTAEKISQQMTVANKPPLVIIFEKSLAVQPDRSVKVEGIATHKMVNISNAQYRVDTGEWMAVAAADGIFDSDLEVFSLTTGQLPKGQHTIEVKVFDAAGNTALDKAKVKID